MVSTRFGWRLALGALLTFAMALAATPASAQEATIFGQVTDASGAVLPGVNVTVSSPALQVKQITEVTSASGEYRITPLPIGTYTVEYTLSGFQTMRREGIRLTAGFVARVDASLALAAVSESVTVSGVSPVVDVKTTSAGTLVTHEILETLPSARNGFMSLLTMGAGTRGLVDDGRLGGTDPGFRAFGRFAEQWTTVDGVSTASPQARNPANSNTFDYETFEEAQIQTLGASAESPTAGVQMNVILKSGGNQFHGGGQGAITTAWMQTNNVDDQLRAQGVAAGVKFMDRWDSGAELGGRVAPDKLWFYGSVRRRYELNDRIGAFYPDGKPSTQSADQRFVIGKVTAQLTSNQKLIGATQVHYRMRKEGHDRFGSPEEYWEHAFWTNVVKGEWQLARGNKFLSVMGGAWIAPSIFNEPLTDISSWSDEVTGFTGGLEDKSGQALNQFRREAKATLSWYKPDLFKGNHDFKLGAQYFLAAADFNQYDVGAAGNYFLVYRSGVPFQVRVQNTPVEPRSRLDYAGLFFQDSWAISRRVTLNLGVRYANDRASLPEQCREAGIAPFANLYPAQCFAEYNIKAWNPISPRLHAAYDVTGDGKTVIKGGWGRFYVMHNQDELNLANLNSRILTTFAWRDLNNNRRWDVGESNLNLNGPDFVSQAGQVASNLSGLVDNPDLKESGSDEFSLSLERELIANLGVRVTGLYSTNFNTLRVLNTLRPYEAFSIPINNPDPGADNRLGTADDPGTVITYYDYPASLAGAAFQRPTFINHAGSDANYKSIEVAANKRLSSRWQMLASYSATKRTNVGLASLAFDPNAEIFAADDTWEWITRVSGSYLFPYDIQVAANLVTQSGEPWARTVSVRGGRQVTSIRVRVEPLGTRRTDTMTTLALRAEKGIRLRSGHQLKVGANVLNLLNANFISYNRDGGASVRNQSGATFGYASSIVNPRLGELVLRYTF